MDTNFKVDKNSKKQINYTKGAVVDSEELEELQDATAQFFFIIGQFGKWQLLKGIYVMFVLFIPLSFHTLNMVFFR